MVFFKFFAKVEVRERQQQQQQQWPSWLLRDLSCGRWRDWLAGDMTPLLAACVRRFFAFFYLPFFFHCWLSACLPVCLAGSHLFISHRVWFVLITFRCRTARPSVCLSFSRSSNSCVCYDYTFWPGWMACWTADCLSASSGLCVMLAWTATFTPSLPSVFLRTATTGNRPTNRKH